MRMTRKRKRWKRSEEHEGARGEIAVADVAAVDDDAQKEEEEEHRRKDPSQKRFQWRHQRTSLITQQQHIHTTHYTLHTTDVDACYNNACAAAGDLNSTCIELPPASDSSDNNSSLIECECSEGYIEEDGVCVGECLVFCFSPSLFPLHSSC